jgi:hypothetical protein
MSDAITGSTVTPLDLTFDDTAGGPVPFVGPVASGTYQPTNYPAVFMNSSACQNEADPDVFTLPAPAGPYTATTLSIFNGDNPNGTWSLYPVNDCIGSGAGTLVSWSIAITTTTQTAARMTSFSAAPAKKGVTVRWRTASEVDTLGFNVYRRTSSGPLRKVNRALIAAKGGPAGASYRFVDRSTRAGVVYTYRLQLVDVDGTRSWYGSARVRARGT